MKRVLILVHRWTGIVLCLFFAMWFASGIVMIYVPFPRLTEAERRDALPPLALDAVQVTPRQALDAAGLEHLPREVRLGMLLDRPVYRLRGPDGAWHVVMADLASPMPALDVRSAAAIASGFAGAPARDAALIHNDQWTVPQEFDAHRPLHRVRLDDPAGTVLYVSSRTGEVLRDTTRSERCWNWFGSVPHWIYPTLLRERLELWRQTVIGLSAVGVVVAVSGLVVGVWRYRWRRAGPGRSRSPYRGWMMWHHWLGVVLSLFVVGWIVSGLLSMNPGRVFSDRTASAAVLDAFAAASPGELLAPRDLPALPFEPRELELRFVGGEPWYVVLGGAGASRLVHARDATRPPLAALDHGALAAAAGALEPHARIVAAELLAAYDTYWYSRHGIRVLPVLRVVFDDADRTWYHLDPARGRVLDRMDDSRRAYRWWFHALHSLDFPWLYARRPLWDAVLIALSAGGFALSVTGVVVGWRRLREQSGRTRARALR